MSTYENEHVERRRCFDTSAHHRLSHVCRIHKTLCQTFEFDSQCAVYSLLLSASPSRELSLSPFSSPISSYSLSRSVCARVTLNILAESERQKMSEAMFMCLYSYLYFTPCGMCLLLVLFLIKQYTNKYLSIINFGQKSEN